MPGFEINIKVLIVILLSTIGARPKFRGEGLIYYIDPSGQLAFIISTQKDEMYN